MSRDELADHLARFHGSSGSPSIAQHTHLHHVQKTNHAHRSARLSEPDHPDWKR